jgi:hypothetical protein
MAVRIGFLELLALAAAVVIASVVVYAVRRRARRRAARGFDVAPRPPSDPGPRV